MLEQKFAKALAPVFWKYCQIVYVHDLSLYMAGAISKENFS
jgi:hypothetical protein